MCFFFFLVIDAEVVGAVSAAETTDAMVAKSEGRDDAEESGEEKGHQHSQIIRKGAAQERTRGSH